MAKVDQGENEDDPLADFGLTSEQIADFHAGKVVVFEFPTGSRNGVAVVAKGEERLRLGIIMIHDPGEGIKSILRLKQRAAKLAIALGLNQLEVFGAAFSNQRFAALLRRRGYTESEEEIPDELGGGTMDILTKIELIQEINP